MLEWHVVTRATYDAGTKNADYLYFLSDTGEIMKGSAPFREAVEMLATSGTWPTTPARKKLYVDPTTLEAKIYTGSAWVQVVKPVSTTVTSGEDALITSGAVYSHVDTKLGSYTLKTDAIKSIAWSGATAPAKEGDPYIPVCKLTPTMADGTTGAAITLDGLAIDIVKTKDATTGQQKLQLKDISGHVINTGVNLDLDRFVKHAEYDNVNKKIILYFDDAKTDKIEIPVGDLVKIYTASSDTTKGVKITCTNNEFATEAIISEAISGKTNLLTCQTSGLFVSSAILEPYMLLDTTATENNITSWNAAGQVKDSGYKPGSSSAIPAAGTTGIDKTFATEYAVRAAIDAINTALAGKMALVSGATTGNLLKVDASGQAEDAGVKAGGSTLAATPDATTLATEVAVKTVADTKQNLVSGTHTDEITTLNASGQVVASGKKSGGATLAATTDANTLATEAAVKAGLDAKQNLAVPSADNAIATLDLTTGQVEDSGKQIGGATLAATPSASTVATEAAVKTALDGKQDLVSGATTNNIATFATGGQTKDSGVAIGGSSFAATASENTVATELGVVNKFVTPTSTSTATEAAAASAVYDMLSWKTTM